MLVGLLAAMAGTPADAFKLDYHDEITREALAQVGRVGYVQHPRGVPPTPARFTDAAIDEIMKANKAMDLTDCRDAKYENENLVAQPCGFLGETVQGVWHVLDGIEPEHFDGEKLQEGSDLVFDGRLKIRDQIRRSKFVGARRTLGRVLHSIQDFYAHSNWINVVDPVTLGKYEARIGRSRNAFAPGSGTPRLARLNEPQCLEGYGLLTQQPKPITDELIARYVASAARGQNTGLVNAQTIRDVLAERPLTSGFYSDPRHPGIRDGVLTVRDGDLPEVIDVGKCRHGWDAVGVARHEGINKDEPGIPGYDDARAAALRHTREFVLQIINDPELKKDRNERPVDPAVTESLLMGFLGHEPMSQLGLVSVTQYPSGPPGQTMWDGVFEVGIIVTAVHPDIVTCLTGDGRTSCSAECSDFNFQSQDEDHKCRVPFPGLGFRVPRAGLIRVEAWDIDTLGRRQKMADGYLNVSDPCLKFAQEPCEVPMERGPFRFSFEAPGAPDPAPIVVRGNPLPPEGGGGSAPAARPPAAVIDDALSLRDRDRCTGADQFMPPATGFTQSQAGMQLGSDAAARVYQVASFAMAISNATAKQNVLNALNAAVGSQAYLAALTGIVADSQQASRVFNGYQSVAGAITGRAASSGLERLLPQQRTAPGDVDRWIMKRLGTPALVNEAVAMMLDPSQNVTAECALNQLAKEGFIETMDRR